VSSQRSIEIRAGLFLLVCLAVGAGLVWKFGKFTPAGGERYPLRVMFDNVGGLIPNANVMYAGVEVGKVRSIELVEDGKLRARVTLAIHQGIKIRADARFVINQSGLLGDRYVDVIPGSTTAKLLTPNAVIEGAPSVDLTEAIRSVTEVLRQAGNTMARVDAILARTHTAIARVDETLLSSQSLQHVTATLANVDTTSSNAVALTQSLRSIVEEARGSITNTLSKLSGSADSLNATFHRADEVVKHVDGVVTHVDGVVARVDGVVKNAEPDVQAAVKNIAASTQRLNEILSRLEKGEGTAGKLLVDPALHDEVLRLVRNLRQHGFIFYRDGARTVAPTPTPTPSPAPRGKTPIPARPATKENTP
jgi:phospholipid/cholesterol/gamma-HCH transport system substrate-binding protein